jgi:hypothetical protein
MKHMGKLYNQDLVCEETLFIDGLSRAGKFLIAKLCSNIKDVEYFQYQPVIEHIPILWFLGLLDANDAAAYMRMSLNMHTYDRAIGRSLNRRKSEGSSILNATDVEIIQSREDGPDGAGGVEAFLTQKRWATFLTHECLPHIELFDKACTKMKMLNIQRHPIDIASSWYIKGWGKRFGLDPLAFIPVVEGEKGPQPWYTVDWQEDYHDLAEVDRIINSICSIYDYDKEAMDSYVAKIKDRVLIINYEELFETPFQTIEKIEGFLDSAAYPNMADILAREGCPKNIPHEERSIKFNKLKTSGSKASIERLVQVSLEYEKKWGLEPIF